uniref:ATP synthase subunit a n=1 Tax=Analcellicampa danfengensis TaxID=2419779 RepID=A0A7U0FNW0_9HYME|nr:ATP synthase F0 subunit 6 [Analcellicampa danfengensis]QQV69251.1 ATP synthase F0 subunit 6 [Analcellicampa danfengensis]
MMNLFSIFDPMSSIFHLSLNWMSSLLGLMFLPQIFWYIMPRSSMILFNISKMIHNEMKTLMGTSYNYGSTLIFLSLFIFIFFNNFLGLFPYIFTSTSHLTFTLSMALPLWLSFIMFGWLKNTNHMFAHLVPQNTPPILMPFMVLIETVSNMIRAMTLSVRLTANMIAGHLLMTLLSSLGVSISTSYIMVLLMIQIMLLLLESAVAIIQSYVFMVLSTLYYSEVN